MKNNEVFDELRSRYSEFKDYDPGKIMRGRKVPEQLLQILSQPDLRYVLLDEEKFSRALDIYNKSKKQGFLGDEIPNRIQWRFLEDLFSGSPYGFHDFDPEFYIYLKDNASIKLLCDYRRYYYLSHTVGLADKVATPAPDEVGEENRTLLSIKRNLKAAQRVEKNYIQRKTRDARMYEFTDGDYIVSLPDDPLDAYTEAFAQGSIFNEAYIEEHAAYGSTLVIMRRASDPDTPFITMNISNNWFIRDIYICGDDYPEASAIDFLFAYASAQGLFLDLRGMHMENGDQVEGYQNYLVGVASMDARRYRDEMTNFIYNRVHEKTVKAWRD